MNRVVVLDRDGTVVEDRHYIRKVEDLVFLPGAVEGLRRLQEKNYPLFLVSNQSGVGRGWITQAEFQAVHRRFLEMCQAEDIAFAQIAYCFHAPEENCPCRKPATGLVPREWNGRAVDWRQSFVVGDHVPDMGLAAALEAQACLVLTGKGRATLQTTLPGGTQTFESLADFAMTLPSNTP